MKYYFLGTSFLSVDIGGVYVHSSGYDYHDGKLYQILLPSSQPISDSNRFKIK